MNNFLKKNKNKKIVILDIPLFLENKINDKKNILVYVQSNKYSILKRLKKRKNFNQKLLKNLKLLNIQLVIKRRNLTLLLKINLLKNLLMMV